MAVGVRRGRPDAPARGQHQRCRHCRTGSPVSLGRAGTTADRRRRIGRESVLGWAVSKPVAGRAALLPVLGEVFRAHGYEGATLALITEATGLGKGSLYHFFPGGKAQMAAAVLDE